MNFYILCINGEDIRYRVISTSEVQVFCKGCNEGCYKGIDYFLNCWDGTCPYKNKDKADS